MFERMLNKNNQPLLEEMSSYCRSRSQSFKELILWLNEKKLSSTITFPYGSHYGWGLCYKIKTNLICNIFPEDDAYTVMLRLTTAQYISICHDVSLYTQKYIKNKYPCSDGGWIHYRVLSPVHQEDIKKLLNIKISCYRSHK